MNIRPLLLIAGLALAGPALAEDCPALMEKIDTTLEQENELDESNLETVRTLRAEGEALLTQGKTAECQAPLNEALALLGEN